MATPIPTVDFGQAQDLVSQQRNDFNNLLSGQKAEQQNLFNQYSTTSAAQPKLVDVLNNAQSQAGLGNLQGNINLFNTQASGVKGLLDRLNEDTKSRTTGTLTNQAMLDRQRAIEGGGLNTQLSRLTTGLGDATNAYNTSSQGIGQLLSATQADQSTALHPLELQINAAGDRFAREITGFTSNKQDELNTLLTKLQNDQTLRLDEWNRANQLADQETAYQHQRSLAAQSSGSSATSLATLLNGGNQNSNGNVTAKAGGGFAFTNAQGSPVSAAVFARNNNIGVTDLLARMGQMGDNYAGGIANAISSAPGVAARPSSLFWGY